MIGEAGGAPAAATIVNQSVISLIETKTLKLTCGHGFNISGQKIEAGASLVVVADSSQGTQGPPGPTGARRETGTQGPAGPAVHTTAVCIKC